MVTGVYKSDNQPPYEDLNKYVSISKFMLISSMLGNDSRRQLLLEDIDPRHFGMELPLKQSTKNHE